MNPVAYARDVYKDLQYGRIMSSSRIIRRVAPPKERTLAWVFEYGPTSLPPGGDEDGTTDRILDLLQEFNARATFGVFGSTAENYPDTPGSPGSKYVSGHKFEHLAAFGLDDFGGVAMNEELTRRIAREGHELANYTYRNIPYAPDKERRSRVCFESQEEVEKDLRRLHDAVYNLTHFEMRFTRPPRDIDVFTDETTAFEIYKRMGYHRLFPNLRFENDKTFLLKLRKTLDGNQNALSGDIIARRDGLDASGSLPDINTLRAELELLTDKGYRVLSVGELMERSAFEDVTPDMKCYEAVKKLDAAGFSIGFRNNRFYPDREISPAEIDTFIMPPRSNSAVVKHDGMVPVKPIAISARAGELYPFVHNPPSGTTRAEVAVWLAEVAGYNGLL